MIPLPFPSGLDLLTIAVTVTVAVLFACWVLPPGVGRALLRLARAACWLLVHPRLWVPVAVVALLAWLAWPVLRHLGGVAGSGRVMPYVVIGAVGAALFGLTVGRAIVQQHRTGVDLAAQYAADPAGDATPRTGPVPDWARE